MNGLGAWSFGYYEYGMDVPADRVAHGIFGYKKLLIDNGFGTGIIADLPVFGSSARDRTIDFQNANGLTQAAGYTPGRIGSTVARFLMRRYSFQQEVALGVPAHLVQQLGGHECSHDIVAQGYYDAGDEGWAEIHMSYHPEITIYQAWDPAFAAHFVAARLKSFYTNVIRDWDGALAAHNVGDYYAKRWVQAGKPISGGPLVAELGGDVWHRCATYVSGVRSMPT